MNGTVPANESSSWGCSRETDEVRACKHIWGTTVA